jgi:hypothetical protein
MKTFIRIDQFTEDQEEIDLLTRFFLAEKDKLIDEGRIKWAGNQYLIDPLDLGLLDEAIRWENEQYD